MKKSNQDQYYLDKEADDFFERGKYDFSTLPDNKRSLVDGFKNLIHKDQVENILEIGCHIGDLLNYSVKEFEATKGYGIEPSSKAVEEANKRFSKNCSVSRGVASEDQIFKSFPFCNLIIINDVFCWISRESVLRSVANIDENLSEGGYLLIRDFFPDRKIRNQNMHVSDAEIFCHKVLGSHAQFFSSNRQL